MSWNAYVDNLCTGGVIQKGSIIGLNGAQWTVNGSQANILEVLAPEAANIGRIMSGDKPGEQFAGSGIVIGGTKYMFLRDLTDSDIKVITGKKAGTGNLILASTTQAVVIAFIPEDKGDSARGATSTVENIAKYLVGAGY